MTPTRPTAPAADPSDPEVAALFADRLAHRRKDLEETAASYRRWMEEAQRKLDQLEETVTEEVTRTVGCRRALEAAGFHVEPVYGLVHLVHTTEDKLPEVYRAIGRLDGQSVVKDIADAKKKLLTVTVRSAICPNIRVTYSKKLRKTDRCRIEKVREKATTRAVLVCGR